MPICAGLGLTSGRSDLSERAKDHLRSSFETFCKTVECELGPDVPVLACDLSNDASIADLTATLGREGTTLDGVVHAVAFDRTLRQGRRDRAG